MLMIVGNMGKLTCCKLKGVKSCIRERDGVQCIVTGVVGSNITPWFGAPIRSIIRTTFGTRVVGGIEHAPSSAVRAKVRGITLIGKDLGGTCLRTDTVTSCIDGGRGNGRRHRQCRQKRDGFGKGRHDILWGAGGRGGFCATVSTFAY